MNHIMEILNKIRPEFDFSKSKSFIEDGMLDSFDIISLVTELEEQFKVVIDGLDIIPENFSNTEAIAALIVRSGGKL